MKPTKFQQFTINNKQTAPIRLPAEDRELIEQQIKEFKARGGKVTKIKTGVSSYTEMSVKDAVKMKGKAHFEQNMKEEIICKGCTEREGKRVNHPKSEFTSRPDMIRLFESTCRVERLRRAKESELRRRRLS